MIESYLWLFETIDSVYFEMILLWKFDERCELWFYIPNIWRMLENHFFFSQLMTLQKQL